MAASWRRELAARWRQTRSIGPPLGFSYTRDPARAQANGGGCSVRPRDRNDEARVDGAGATMSGCRRRCAGRLWPRLCWRAPWSASPAAAASPPSASSAPEPTVALTAIEDHHGRRPILSLPRLHQPAPRCAVARSRLVVVPTRTRP